MAEYICTISAREYRALVESNTMLSAVQKERNLVEDKWTDSQQQYIQASEELTKARERLEEMAKDLEKHKEASVYWYDKHQQLKDKLAELEGKPSGKDGAAP